MSVEEGVPPRRADVLRILAEHRDELAAMSVTSLAVFGSVARDEAQLDSDVDLLVTFHPSRSVGLFQLLDVQRRLADVLGRKVDLGMPNAVKAHARDRIYADHIPVLVEAPGGGLAVVPHDDADLLAVHDRRRARPAPPPRWVMHAENMLGAATAIERYTAGLDFDRFRADHLTRSASLGNLTRLGEAARHIPDELRARYPAVPWEELIDTGEDVIVRYDDIDVAAVWRVVREQIPMLVPILRDMLAREATP